MELSGQIKAVDQPFTYGIPRPRVSRRLGLCCDGCAMSLHHRRSLIEG